MQPVRYAEGSAPVNCLAAGVCSEKGQGEPGLVEAERGFSMAIVEGWNQWAATIYILNQWQFPVGKQVQKWGGGKIASPVHLKRLRGVHQTLVAAQMVQFTFTKWCKQCSF